MNDLLASAAEKAIEALQKTGLSLSTAESCTAGMMSMALCAASDGGEHYASGFVTYNNAAKETLINVNQETLAQYTAVSAEVVAEMAIGAARVAKTDLAISVSGYAGPDGGEDGTPAGTVWFSWHLGPDKDIQEVRHFEGDCESVILQASVFGLEHLVKLLA